MKKLKVGLKCGFNVDFWRKSLESILPRDSFEISEVDPYSIFKPISNTTEIDFLVVILRYDDFGNTLTRFFNEESFEVSEIMETLQTFLDQIKNAAKNTRKTLFLLPTIDTLSYKPWTLDSKMKCIKLLSSMYSEIIRSFTEENSNIICIDLISDLGMVPEYDSKLDYWNKVPYSLKAFQIINRCIADYLKVLSGETKKVIVVDLDNTLWGGVAAEDGITNLKVGELEARSKSFLEFQKVLLSLSNTGYLLAICSKNNPEIVEEVFNQRSDMPMKKDHFVTLRVNWLDKVENLKSIAHELNLGLSSFIFIDDSPLERDFVARNLPEVSVFHMDKNPYRRVSDLVKYGALMRVSRTHEDAAKLQQYRDELNRMQRKSEFLESDLKEWVNQLEISLTYFNVDTNNTSRAVQILNKTNQMNLAGRRFSEQSFKTTIESLNQHTVLIHAKDKFGDYGIIGLISSSIQKHTITITDFVLSCRALGRSIEYKMFLDYLEKYGSGRELRFNYVETKANIPIKIFLDSITEKPFDFSSSEHILRKHNLELKIESTWENGE